MKRYTEEAAINIKDIKTFKKYIGWEELNQYIDKNAPDDVKKIYKSFCNRNNMAYLEM